MLTYLLAHIKALWDRFVTKTGRTEEDVKGLIEKDLNAEMEKRGFSGFDASDIRGYWKTFQGSCYLAVYNCYILGFCV